MQVILILLNGLLNSTRLAIILTEAVRKQNKLGHPKFKISLVVIRITLIVTAISEKVHVINGS